MEFPVRSYPAKVLLFGEHTVLLGGDALAVPLEKYSCQWNSSSDKLEVWWQDFINYLESECADFLSVDRLQQIYKKTYLQWDIPVGYGLGSSGAITAAIYDFCKVRSYSSVKELQGLLGHMESFFHGKSSGFDPLISYCHTGLHKSATGMNQWSGDMRSDLQCYLLDSGMPRSGKNSIEQFRKNASEDPQPHLEITDLNNQIIKRVVKSGLEMNLIADLKELSRLQLQRMSYMIVDELEELWKTSFKRDDLVLKICGAGGGGYYLLFAKEEMDQLGPFKLEKIN